MNEVILISEVDQWKVLKLNLLIMTITGVEVVLPRDKEVNLLNLSEKLLQSKNMFPQLFRRLQNMFLLPVDLFNLVDMHPAANMSLQLSRLPVMFPPLADQIKLVEIHLVANMFQRT
eukprot:NODE_618_length_5352_cov_0.421854.p5 type:complete len:117 gc:universal NODE_618_length_5352_cov_0.421854:669-319(-)